MNKQSVEILIEKYRPTILSEICGQDKIINKLKDYVASKNIPNLLFSGPPGSGKTTSALCLAHELYKNEWKSNFMELNASDNRGIDTIRGIIKEYAGIKSMGRIPFKIILLDEADSLCLDKDTEILIGEKNMKKLTKIKDIPQNEYIDIPSLNMSTQKIENDKGKCVDSGNVEMYKITLENGKEIIASSEHPFFSLNKNGEIIEIKTKELNKESKILNFENQLLSMESL